ncbi:putative GPI transamidase component GAA1 [Leptomonas seymouri]|uniref:Putative GPI transamidase component GAA1 n=1 Tax=Leptomonas seymouri TaxID=5684 RepID=A0A0N0P2W7_LEPSE|nr:putative GPI transamidase component GAA1 [Leptomonas seymouri]|eukprot:KPI82977.1 putative GPI transamidase component GAA1 [Leptomonas seymouri]
MLRKLIYSGARHHGGKLSPLFLLLGIAMLCLLPILKPPIAKIDENAVGHRSPQLTFGSIDKYLIPTVSQPQRLVRGRRSPGSEIVAVYVNTDYAAATAIANALIEVLRTRKNLACDVQFYFVNSTEEWLIPHSYTRAAIVLNMSSMYNSYVCYDTLGSNGIQPNQDLPNVAAQHAFHLHIIPSFLCQRPGGSRANLQRPFWHYWSYLEASMQLAIHPQPWHAIPTHSINTLTISTNTYYSEPSTKSGSKVPRKLVNLVLLIIDSLNGLEEKFHHSTFVWLPVSLRQYVEYDVAQFCIVLFVASIFSTAYAEYQRRGITITPLFVGLLFTPVGASVAFHAAQWLGVAVASLLFAGVFRVVMPHATSGMWMSFNAIALCLLIILQPACGLVAGCAVAIQVSFIHPALFKSFPMAVGAVVSWALCSYFVYHLQLPLLGLASISELFISFVVYPNAVWITSRFMCTVA